MTDAPRRPILKLKFPPPASKAPAPEPAPPPAHPAGTRWKCKPCGGIVIITGDEPADQEVRCPACNARLGVAGDFLPEGDAKVRARRLPPLRNPA